MPAGAGGTPALPGAKRRFAPTGSLDCRASRLAGPTTDFFALHAPFAPQLPLPRQVCFDEQSAFEPQLAFAPFFTGQPLPAVHSFFWVAQPVIRPAMAAAASIIDLVGVFIARSVAGSARASTSSRCDFLRAGTTTVRAIPCAARAGSATLAPRHGKSREREDRPAQLVASHAALSPHRRRNGARRGGGRVARTARAAAGGAEPAGAARARRAGAGADPARDHPGADEGAASRRGPRGGSLSAAACSIRWSRSASGCWWRM